jgi:hypothetical protein
MHWAVCGEDCAIQICPECASDDRKGQVVDFIMQRTLSEVTPQDGTLDELLLTIPSCRHSFTVETLDGHTGMTDFYIRNEQDGRWVGLLAPTGFKNPPTCPTCRAPITAPRYGRIVKRADLDILERNVAARMSRALSAVQSGVQTLSEETIKTSLAREAATIVIRPSKSKTPINKQRKARDVVLNATGDVPISERDLNAANAVLHGINPAVAQIWRRETRQLFNAYNAVTVVAKTRSAHTLAWEAAFSFLYEREIQSGINNPAGMPKRPQEHAMRVAKMRVGQWRPLADRRFLVEAFWSTLHIRLTLIRLAQAWLEEVSKREASYPAYHRQAWATYIDFLLRTCVRDALKAYEVAEFSEAHRQVVKTALLRMRIDLERFRFMISMSKQTGTIKTARTEMVKAAANHGHDAKNQMQETIKKYFLKKTVGSRVKAEEQNWVEENFSGVARTIIEEWAEIQRAIRLDTFYQPVSLEEKMQIVGAMGFGARLLRPCLVRVNADEYFSFHWALLQLSKWTHVCDR